MSRAGDQERRSSDAPPRDNYIPLRPGDLVRKLGNEPQITIFEREAFRRLCELIEATIHHEYRSRLNQLKEAYGPFDPDDDALVQYVLTDAERAARCESLFEEFDALLLRANYRRLSRNEIEQAIRSPAGSGFRLHLDLKLFERLEVYARGQCELVRPTPSWQKVTGKLRLPLFSNGASTHGVGARMPTTVGGYRRLAVIFRLRQRSPLTDPLDTRAVVLKLFKDIPQEDIETLLPGADIRIGLFEQAKIVVPTLTGLGLTLVKLLKGLAAIAFAGIYGLLAFLGLISGVIGYGVRSFLNYLRTREKHQLSLTRNLYFQNLDNNAGVIYHLLAEAEDQEFREMVLAWWLLWRGGLAGATAEQIDAAAERWLLERCGIPVDFEISDALAKLKRFGLAYATNGRWRAAPIQQALQTLDRAWDDQFDYRPPGAGKRAA